MLKPRMSIPVIALGIALLSSGCNKQTEGAPEPTDTVTTNTPETAPATAPVAALDIGVTTDAAIAKENIALTFRVVDGPYYDKVEDQVRLLLEAKNEGTVVLSGKGQFPVNLGLTIVGPDGTAKTAPGNLEFQRIRFANPMQPGDRFEFPVVFNAGPTIGGSVVLDGVQEGVSWFRDYGKPTLTLGKFSRCGNNKPATLCDESGTQVAPAK